MPAKETAFVGSPSRDGLSSISGVWGPDWVTAVNGDPENHHIGRMSQFTLRLESNGEDSEDFVYTAGVLTPQNAGAAPEADFIHIQGSPAAWIELADANAAPRRHDLLALLKASDGLTVIAGYVSLLRHLRVITRLVEIGKTNATA